MHNSTAPLTDAKVGDVIGMDLMPDYVWTGTILEIEDCDPDVSSRSVPHQRFKVIDPDDNEDWLCAYDTHKVAP